MHGVVREHLNPAFWPAFDVGTAFRTFSQALHKIAIADKRRDNRSDFAYGMGRTGTLIFVSRLDCLVFYCAGKKVADVLEETLNGLGYPGRVAQTLVEKIDNPTGQALVVYSLSECSLAAVE